MSAAPQLAGRHLLGSLDLAPDEVHALLGYAAEIKAGRARPALVGKVATFLFFNPSVRTRVSCEAALARFGGTGITLAAGKDTWSFECGEGVVMDAGTQEHVRELAPVLSRMGRDMAARLYCGARGRQGAGRGELRFARRQRKLPPWAPGRSGRRVCSAR
jgi:ornithine carbamoyltransferase